MTHLNLALIGFGNVGQALARLFLRKAQELRQNYDLTFCVTGIATGQHGLWINPHGLDLEAMLQNSVRGQPLGRPEDAFKGNTPDFICACPAEVLLEITPVNHQSGEPAIHHLRLGLQRGMHVITANKGPVAHAYRELAALATQVKRRFYFESAVMDGAPIFSLFRTALPGARLLSFRGLLNSTTNLILTQMEQGSSFDEALRYAQAVGLAETDPSADIDGWDAAIKVAILVTVLMDIPCKPQQVKRQGIRGITLPMIAKAKAEGKRWKLVCTAERKGDRVETSVAPQLLDSSSPLYQVSGPSSIIEFHTDVLPTLSIIEGDPTPDTTAYGLLADLLNAIRE